MTGEPPLYPQRPRPGWYPDPGGEKVLPLVGRRRVGTATRTRSPRGHRSRQSWPRHYTVLAGILAVGALFLAGAIGAKASGGAVGGNAAPAPAVTITVLQHDPGATATITATATPTANAQGEATQISADGVYVIGQDIPGGTWHTSGGSKCYEATLASTDASNIIDNNNFTGPDTMSLAGAKAFDISGGCTWQQEG
jgi:hypothetical protein